MLFGALHFVVVVVVDFVCCCYAFVTLLFDLRLHVCLRVGLRTVTQFTRVYVARYTPARLRITLVVPRCNVDFDCSR